ncbi:MAG: hypothetical protein AB8B55_02255 [Mariniblastus sp.]
MSDGPSYPDYSQPSPYAPPKSPYTNDLNKSALSDSAKKHSGVGIASFVIGLIASAIAFATLIGIFVLVSQELGRQKQQQQKFGIQLEMHLPDEDAGAGALAIGLGALGSMGIAAIGAGLATISFFLYRKQLFAILGLTLNLGVILFFGLILLIGFFAG